MQREDPATDRSETRSSPVTVPVVAPVEAGESREVPSQDSTGGTMEYYILCPQRPSEVPGLITHLISRDICDKRQAENYHKCPNCIRSRVWRERNGLPVEEPAGAAAES